MSAPGPSVVYVLPDTAGGSLTIIANLLAHRRPDGFRHRVVLTHGRLGVDSRFEGSLAADEQTVLEHSLPVENLRSVLRRLSRAVGPGPGVLVANDLLELAMVSVFDLGRTVVQVLHGDWDYYYELAARHEAVVHAFVAYSQRVFERLRSLLPHRHESIFHLPYGVEIPARGRVPVPGPLRALYAGRIERRQKGVFDLPEIDRRLLALGVPVLWTLVGGGPDEAELEAAWPQGERVRRLGPRSNAEVLELCLGHDVFVLPTRAEGLPVELLEAMAAGVVPVVSDLPSGVPEVVEPGRTGFRPAIGDTDGFAQAIRALDRDRGRLEEMSRAARRLVAERFDIRDRAGAYQDLFGRWRELYRPRPKQVTFHYGSRLDQPWLPNAAVYAIRAARRQLAGQRWR